MHPKVIKDAIDAEENVNMKNRTLAESFAKGRTKGKGSHMFIDGNVIYSYGYHFPIARLLDDKIAIITTRKYSSSTSRHTTTVHHALSMNGWNVVSTSHVEDNGK